MTSLTAIHVSSVQGLEGNMYNRSESVNQTVDDVRGSLEYRLSLWLYMYSPWITITISALGNGAAFITLLKMRPFSSLLLIVAYLAVMDTLCVSLNFSYSILIKQNVSLGVAGCRVMVFFMNYTTSLANWTVVVMTVERFVAVTYPLKIARSFTIKKSTIYLLAIAIVFIFPPCPTFWVYTELDDANQQKRCVEKPGFEGLLLVMTWVDLILISLLPCCLLIFLNSAIVRSLYKAAKLRREVLGTGSEGQSGRPSGTSERRPKFPHAHLSLMLVGVSIAFILLQLPITIYYIIDRYRPPTEDPIENVRRRLTAYIMHSLNELNHSFNFIFYFLSGKRFRQRFLEVFYCRKLFRMVKRRKDNNTADSMSYIGNSCETKMLKTDDMEIKD